MTACRFKNNRNRMHSPEVSCEFKSSKEKLFRRTVNARSFSKPRGDFCSCSSNIDRRTEYSIKQISIETDWICVICRCRSTRGTITPKLPNKSLTRSTLNRMTAAVPRDWTLKLNGREPAGHVRVQQDQAKHACFS